MAGIIGFLTSLWTWRSAFRSDQKEKMAEFAKREHRETHDIEQTKKKVHSSRVKTSFGQNVSELVFGCQHI